TIGSIVLSGISDSFVEGNESFTVAVSSAPSVTGTNTTSGFVIDDTSSSATLTSISLSLSGTSFHEQLASNSVTLYAVVTNVSTGLSSALWVPLTYNGVAIQGTDYSGATSISIAQGSTVGSIVLTGISDSLFEGSESFSVSVTATSSVAGTNTVSG